MNYHEFKRGLADSGIAYDGHLESMTRCSVLLGSWVKSEILEEPPFTNLKFPNTSKEEPLAGTMYLESLQ